MLPLLIMAAIVAVIYLVVVHGRRHASLPTSDGRAPLDHELAVRFWDLKEAEAAAGATTVPQRLHYAPRYDQRTNVSGPPALAEQVLATTPGPPPILTLEELTRQPGVVYGVTPDGRRLTDGGRAMSIGIGGLPGSGKSSTAATYVRQHHARNAEILIGDPHAGHEESLIGRLGSLVRELPGDQVAETPREILMLVERAHAELERRTRIWRLDGGRDRRPVVVAIDEWTSLLRRPEIADRLLSLLEDIGQQGRKYGVAAILLAQSWTTAAVGSSQVRNPLPGAVIHRMRPDEARMLSGLRAVALPTDTLELAPGEAYVAGIEGALARVRVPQLQASGPTFGSSFALPSADLPATVPDLRLLSPEGRPEARPEGRDAEIVAMIRRGARMTEVVKTVYGVEATGQPYQRACEEIMATIARWLPGGEA